MSELYPWMNEFLRSFRWTLVRVEHGRKVSYKGSYEEILPQSEDPKTEEKKIQQNILEELTAGLRLIFGKYWNPGCVDRLKNLHRNADDSDIRTPFEAMDAQERFLYLMDRLNFIGLYTKYLLICDDLTLESEQVKQVRDLLDTIRAAKTTDDPLNDEAADDIRAYYRQFAAEFAPYLKDSSDLDEYVLFLYKALVNTYAEQIQNTRKACEEKGTAYEHSEAFAAFSEEATEAGEVLKKWYFSLAKKAQRSPAQDVHVYDRAIRDAIKAAEEDRPKKCGRKSKPEPVLDEEILKETSKNSMLNLMSDAEFEFLRQVNLLKVKQYYSNRLSWENAPGKLREDAAEVLEKFSHDDAILAYMKVDRSQADEAVEELLNTIRYPLYPMQKKLNDAIYKFLDMTNDAAEFSKHCRAKLQYCLEKQLEEIAETLGVDIACPMLPCSLPKKEISGDKLWLDVLTEDQVNASGIPQKRRKQIFTYTVQILQLMFGRHLRPECALRLAESVRGSGDTEAYKKSDEYQLYHAYCCLVRECRGVFETFLDECRNNHYVNKEKAGQIEAFFKEAADFMATLYSPDEESLNGVRHYSEKAAAFCTEQQRMQFHENAVDETLFDISWKWDVLERFDVFQYHPVYSFQEQRHILRELCAYIGSAEEGMHDMYDFLWARTFRLDDAAEMNRMHMEYGNTKQEYAPGYRFSISDEEYTFLSCVCGIAGKIRGNVPRITPEMLTEKERKDLLTAAETLAESKSLYYYIDTSQADRKYVRQIAEHHLLYPRACRINHIVRLLCIRSQEIGLFEENADRDILHQWAYFISKAADTTEKKYNKFKDGRGDPISEMITEFAKKSRINGFRVVRKTSGKSGKR